MIGVLGLLVGTLAIQGQTPPANDAFSEALVIEGSPAALVVSNVAATREAGEPSHAGNPGGASVWFSWTAPSNGPVRVDTEGSGLDTLLAVYTGDDLATLVEIGSNDDLAGGIMESVVSFTAEADVTYRIAVDGYSGDGGELRLNLWLGPLPPRITVQPKSTAVVRGATLTLAVDATGEAPLAFQWARDGVNLEGGIGANLVIANAQDGEFGVYTVAVSNQVGAVFSAGAVVTVHSVVVSRQPSDLTVAWGYPAAFTVAADGGIDPVGYQWLRNGIPMDGATQATLRIAEAKLTNAGVYSAEVTVGAARVLSSNVVLEVIMPFEFTTFAGRSFTRGTNDGLGTVARFSYPHGICVNEAGDAFVSEVGSYSIRKLTPAGEVSTWARLGPILPFYDPYRGGPWGLTVDASNTLYVADTPHHTIVRISPDGVAATLAGLSGVAGFADGAGEVARFNIPSDVALDGFGNVVVADWENDRIRLVDPTGLVRTIAGPGRSPYFNGRWTKARFYMPSGVEVDQDGNTLVIDEGYHCVRQITTTGSVHTAAGPNGGYGVADGLLEVARFNGPHGGAMDQFGNLYVADMGNARVRRVTPAGMVTTLAGRSAGSTLDGIGMGARFRSPRGVAIDRHGTLYVADFEDHVIRKGVSVPFMLGTLTNVAGILGGEARFEISADGVGPLDFQWQFEGMDKEGETNAVLRVEALRSWHAGAYAVVVRNALGSRRSTNANLTVAQGVGWGDNTCYQSEFPTTLSNVVAVTAGGARTLALKADGAVAAWGCVAPASVAGLTNIVAVAAGGSMDLLLAADGRVYERSDNRGAVPVSGLQRPVAIAAGNQHGLVLDSDGTVVAWGSNRLGQTNVPATLTNAIAIAAGESHSLALTSDGAVVGWGDNSHGQATPPEGLATVVDIAAGANHSLALCADGTVAAWGSSEEEQCAVPPELTNVVAITAGRSHNAALLQDGTVVVWGSNTHGQRQVPVGLTRAAALTSGNGDSVAVVGEGPPIVLQPSLQQRVTVAQTVRLRAVAVGRWPLRFQWQREGTDIPGATNAVLVLTITDPAQAGDYRAVVSNDLGSARSEPARVAVDPLFILRAPTSQVVSRGSDVQFTVQPFGKGPWSYQWQFDQEDLPGATNASFTLSHVQPESAGRYAVLVSNDYGTVRSDEGVLTVLNLVPWGDPNSGGSLPATATNVVAIAAGYSHNLALREDGTVVGWGLTTVPEALTDVVALAAGANFSLALRGDGTVIGWGDNFSGQVTPPADLVGVVAIAAGEWHSLALRADGSVATWGLGSFGLSAVPAGLTNATAIAAGRFYSLALTGNGEVVAWGDPDLAWVPAELGVVRGIAVAGAHSVALQADGTVATWGDRAGGHHVVAGVSNVSRIAAGLSHGVALKEDGTVVAWGSNIAGESEPPHFLEETLAIAANGYHSLALVGRPPPAPVLQGVQVNAGRWEVSVSTLRGQSYQLEFTDSLENPEWRPVPRPPLPGDGTVKSLGDPAGALGRRFYRVRVP